MPKLKSRLFISYIASYLLVLFLPLVVINGLFSQRFILAYRNEINSKVQADLAQLAAAIDRELETMSQTASEIRLTMDLPAFSFLGDPLASRDAISRLSAYRTTNPLIEEVVLYPAQDEFAVASSSTCRKDLLVSQLLRSPELSADQLRQLLETVEVPTALPHVEWKGAREYLCMVYPIRTDYQTLAGSCLFLLPEASLSRLLEEKMGNYSASTYVLDRDGRPLFSSFALDSLSPDALAGNETLPQGRVVVDDEPYFAGSVQSGLLEWQYISLVPENQQLFQQLHTVSRELVLTTLLVVLAAGALIFVLMRVNYIPIRRLKEKALRIAHEEPVPHRSELDLISVALDTLSSRNLEMAERLESNAATIKNIYLQRLLAGRYATHLDFNRAAAECGLALKSEWYFAASVRVTPPETNLEVFAEQLQKALAPQMECCYIFTLEPGRILTVNGIRQEQEPEIAALYEQVRAQLSRRMELSVTVGLGSVGRETAGLPRSMMEAGQALDYRFVCGNDRTISIGELSLPGTPARYPHRQFEKLRNALQAGNEPETTAAVEQIMQYLESSNLPLFSAKNVCFELLNTFSRQLRPDDGLRCEAENSLLSLSSLDTAQDVLALVRELRKNLNKTSAPPSDRRGTETLISEMVEYVDQNCLRCDFSLQEMSERFNMLLPNLSQFFKDKTGQNLLDYSTSLRMNRACKLLVETQLPLKELGYQVGYYNVSSFIRRFKQTQGVTPGDYRRMYSTQQDPVGF